jgi:hypothetical protein
MNPFRSPQFDNSSKLLNKLETYHLHQTHLSNKPSSHKIICSPKNQRINNVKRIEIISGTGDRRQKLYRKKGRKLVLSEKADKIKKNRKYSDFTKKSVRVGGRELLFRQRKDKSFKLMGKGSPNLHKNDYRNNYSIGNQKFLLNKKTKWGREDTLQSQYDISSDFIQSKENYNMYLNTKNNAPLVMGKMKKILNMQNSERSLLESMRISRRVKLSEESKKIHPMVFMKRKQKKANLSKKSNSRNNSKIVKRTKGGISNENKIETRSRKNSNLRKTKGRINSKSPKNQLKSKKNAGFKKLKQNETRRKVNSSRNTKKEYMMDVFVSMTQKKQEENQYHSETNPKLENKKEHHRKWSQNDPKGMDHIQTSSKRKVLKNFLKKTNQMEKFLKHMNHVKKSQKQELMVLVTESSKETSQNISSKKESTVEKMRMEDLLEKTKETRQLMDIFREQKTSIFENKRQTEDQINSVFLKLLNLMEQERVRALKVIEDQFQRQKQDIFDIEKQLVLKEQNMHNLLRYKSSFFCYCFIIVICIVITFICIIFL